MVHHIVHPIYGLLTGHFLLFWFFSLVLVTGVGWLLSSDTSPVSFAGFGPGSWEATAKLPSRFGLADALSGFLFVLFAIAYIGIIFYKEDFSYYDDDLL